MEQYKYSVTIWTDVRVFTSYIEAYSFDEAARMARAWVLSHEKIKNIYVEDVKHFPEYGT